MMGLPRFARKDEWRFYGHCEECGDEAISISLTFAIGSYNCYLIVSNAGNMPGSLPAEKSSMAYEDVCGGSA
jgi:hypothetical protein